MIHKKIHVSTDATYSINPKIETEGLSCNESIKSEAMDEEQLLTGAHSEQSVSLSASQPVKNTKHLQKTELYNIEYARNEIKDFLNQNAVNPGILNGLEVIENNDVLIVVIDGNRWVMFGCPRCVRHRMIYGAEWPHRQRDLQAEKAFSFQDLIFNLHTVSF